MLETVKLSFPRNLRRGGTGELRDACLAYLWGDVARIRPVQNRPRNLCRKSARFASLPCRNRALNEGQCPSGGMVDAGDSKSPVLADVPVRVRPWVPYILCFQGILPKETRLIRGGFLLFGAQFRGPVSTQAPMRAGIERIGLRFCYWTQNMSYYCLRHRPVIETSAPCQMRLCPRPKTRL